MFTILYNTKYEDETISIMKFPPEYKYEKYVEGMKQPEGISVFIFPDKDKLLSLLQDWDENFFWVSEYSSDLLDVQQWHGRGILTSGDGSMLSINIAHHARRICEIEFVRKEVSKKRYFISDRVYKNYFNKVFPIKTRPPINIDGAEEIVIGIPKRIDEELKEIYRQFEKVNRFALHPRRAWEYVQTLFLADIKPNDIVLEVGSGGSLVLYWLAKKCKKVYSIDPAYVNERNLAKDFFEQKNIDVLQGSSCSMEMIPDNSINKIIMISSIEHFLESEDAPKKALIECKRVLKHNGIIAGTTDFASESDFSNLGERKYDKKSFLDLIDKTGLKLSESDFNIYYQGKKVFVPSIHYITLGFFLTK